MALSLSQLLPEVTKAQWLAELLLSAQGIGAVKRDPGLGSGSMTASGVSIVTQSVRVRISTGGELGTAQFQLSQDGGVTYGSATTLPSNGTVSLAGTGVTLRFAGGPSGSGESFTVGDLYYLELTTPTLAATAWQAGSTPLTLMQVLAEGFADLGRTIQAVTKGGLLRYSTGAWLDLLAYNYFNLTRNPGVVSHRTLRLTDAAGVGPLTVTTGQLWVGSTAGSGLRWTNTAGGTLNKNGTLDLDFAAEAIGGKYNVGAGVIDTFFTAVPGVTVGDPGGVATITTAGQDKETDASLITRCLARWPSLGTAAPNENYDLWAKTATANVTRTKVRASPTVPGQVELYLGGAAGGVSGADVTAVTSYITPRLGTTVTALIQSVSVLTQAITATVYCAIGTKDAVTAGCIQNLTALFIGGVDTFGEQLAPIPIGGTIYVNQVVEQLQTPAGVRNVVLTTPGADVALTAIQVASLGTITLTVTEVA